MSTAVTKRPPNRQRSPERSHIRPSRARKQAREEQAIRLRRMGLSYRAIGAEVGVSHVHARRLVESAYKDIAQRSQLNTAAALGEDLDRVDGVIRAASAIMLSQGAEDNAKLRAATVVLRGSEARVRWLGLAAPERFEIGGFSRGELERADVENLSDEQIDAELRVLGYAPVAELGGGDGPAEPPDEGEALDVQL